MIHHYKVGLSFYVNWIVQFITFIHFRGSKRIEGVCWLGPHVSWRWSYEYCSGSVPACSCDGICTSHIWSCTRVKSWTTTTALCFCLERAWCQSKLTNTTGKIDKNLDILFSSYAHMLRLAFRITCHPMFILISENIRQIWMKLYGKVLCVKPYQTCLENSISFWLTGKILKNFLSEIRPSVKTLGT